MWDLHSDMYVLHNNDQLKLEVDSEEFTNERWSLAAACVEFLDEAWRNGLAIVIVLLPRVVQQDSLYYGLVVLIAVIPSDDSIRASSIRHWGSGG